MEKGRWLGPSQVLLAGDAIRTAKRGKRILKHRLDDPESEQIPTMTLCWTELGDLQLGSWIGSRQLGIIPSDPSLPATGWQLPLHHKLCASHKRHRMQALWQGQASLEIYRPQKSRRKRIHGSKVLPVAQIMLVLEAKQKSQLPTGTFRSAFIEFSG